jgi:hypothetical protein
MRVQIKTENKNQVVYLDGKVHSVFSHYEDYAYTNAQKVAGDLKVKIQRGELEND